MENKLENPQVRTQKRVCQKCGKNYTINTTNLEDNLDNYPSICLWCQNPSIHPEIKKYAQDIENKTKITKTWVKGIIFFL